MPTEFPERRTILGLTGSLLAAITTPGCSNGRSSSTRSVAMTDDLAFDPETTRIERGDTVRWKNAGGIEHTVTAYEDEIPDGAAYFASGGFESEAAAKTHLQEGLVGPDEVYEHTFEQSGTYEYFCIPHEGSGMVGTVQVK